MFIIINSDSQEGHILSARLLLSNGQYLHGQVTLKFRTVNIRMPKRKVFKLEDKANIVTDIERGLSQMDINTVCIATSIV